MLIVHLLFGGDFVRVEIWSDFVCPFCYIGKRRFESALEQFAHKDQVEVIFRSFELDPHAKKDIGKDIHTVLAEKYGLSYERAKEMNRQIGEQAREVGLIFHFDTMIPTNTFDAHRLFHFAKKQGKINEVTERLLKAYFTDSLHIGDHEVLAKLAEEVGLDKKVVLAVLQSDDYSENVRHDEEMATKLGINAVPFFVFNNKYGVSGAQPTNVFLEVLEKVWKEEEKEQKIQVLQSDHDNIGDQGNCADGSCKI